MRVLVGASDRENNVDVVPCLRLDWCNNSVCADGNLRVPTNRKQSRLLAGAKHHKQPQDQPGSKECFGLVWLLVRQSWIRANVCKIKLGEGLDHLMR